MSHSEHAEALSEAVEHVSAVFEDDSPQVLGAAADKLAAPIRSCPSADALDGMLEATGPIADLLSMGDASLPIWPEVIDALLDLAGALADAEGGARVAGWAFWCCTSAPLDALRSPKAAVGAAPDGAARRPSAVAAVRRRGAELRAWLDHPTAPMRAAAAMLLGATASPDADSDDAGALAARAIVEDDRTALGSLLVGGAIAHARIGRTLDERFIQRARTAAGDSDALLAACAAAAMASSGVVLDATAAMALARATTQPVALPVAWGWRTPARIAYRSDALCLAVLGDATVEDAVLVIRELAGAHVAPSGDLLGLGEVWARALVHLAFDARGSAIPRCGLAAWELDEPQRLAVSALARERPRAPVTLARLGLPPTRLETLDALLASRSPDFQPFAVTLGDHPVTVHFGRLWCLTLEGRIAVDAAVQAVTAAFTPLQALQLAIEFGPSRPIHPEVREGSEAAAREEALVMGVARAVATRGFDPAPLLQAVAADRRSPPAGVAGRALAALST